MKDLKEFYIKASIILRSSFNLTDAQILKITNRYVRAVQNELNVTGIKFYTDSSNYHVSLKAIGSKSRSTINKQQVEMHTWFMDNCPLFKIVSLGSNIEKKFTEILMYYNVDTMVDSLYASAENEENIKLEDAVEVLYGEELSKIIFEADESKIDIVPVNLESLGSYINVTNTYIYANKKNLINTDTLEARVREAKRIYTLASVCGGHLLQIKTNSEFGRQFYKGPNLQSCHKDIRHAALGKCIEYDINNAVYTWRLHEVKTITKEYNTEMQFPCTIDYLDRKDALRLQLVKDVYGTSYLTDKFKLKLIKQAFTAIGFGAQGTGTPLFWFEDGTKKTYALNNIITNPNKRSRFLNHPFIQEFIEEQNTISKIIASKHKNDYKDVEAIKSASGKISEAKLLAYLYQHVETELMDNALSHIPKENLLLRCHDAFYVSHISTDDILEVKYKMQKDIPGLTLDKTEINEWITADPRFIQTAEDELADHRRIMAEEMEKAKNYVPKHLDNVIQLKPQLSDDERYMKFKAEQDAEILRLQEEVRKQEAGRKQLEQILIERGIMDGPDDPEDDYDHNLD